MDAMNDKKEIRASILALRDKMTQAQRAERDAAIKNTVLNMDKYREASSVLAYVSYRSEVGTKELIRQALQDGKNVFAPKVSGREIEFWQIGSVDDLREGYRGIWEPEESISFTDWFNSWKDGSATDRKDGRMDSKIVMWMPGAVFDRHRNRIGYGGGYYDRYMSRLNRMMEDAIVHEQNEACPIRNRLSFCSIAFAYSCQVLDEIPCEEHDIKPDMIVTEKGITGT